MFLLGYSSQQFQRLGDCTPEPASHSRSPFPMPTPFPSSTMLTGIRRSPSSGGESVDYGSKILLGYLRKHRNRVTFWKLVCIGCKA